MVYDNPLAFWRQCSALAGVAQREAKTAAQWAQGVRTKRVCSVRDAMTYFLAIETSCDETAAAVFTDEPRVLSNVVASQTDLHARFGGVVPEVAARAHLQRLLPVIDEALRQAGVTPRPTSAASPSTTRRGWSARCSSASARPRCSRWPSACRSSASTTSTATSTPAGWPPGATSSPASAWSSAAGTRCCSTAATPLHFELLGGTLDDAAGEAFDKVAALLGLGFPGGPAVEREAAARQPHGVHASRARSCTTSGSTSASAA